MMTTTTVSTEHASPSYITIPKNILITGGAGFIGHHVVEYFLKNTNHNLICIDRLDYSGNLNRLNEVINRNRHKNRVKVIYHDLKAELSASIQKQIGHVDFIFHLAVQSHVDRSIEFPMEFIQDNVIGTANILEYARKLKELECFIYFSTDEVFGPALKGNNFTEYARYNSTNPYSATKAAGEEITVAYHNTFNVPAIITHTMNVFGHRQNPEKFIPGTIRKVKRGETVYIHSDPTKTYPGSRFYIFAEYVADALNFLIGNKAHYRSPYTEDVYGAIKIQKYNIVGQKELNNLEIAQLIANCVGKPLKYELVDFHSSRPGHDLRYALSGDKMKLLGWVPPDTVENSLAQVVSWYERNEDWLNL